MRLHPFTVGPIVGETCPDRVRLWGRGDSSLIDGVPRRCFGALRFKKRGTAQWSSLHLFKMNPNFDMTGVVILSDLSPETRYDYEAGYFFSEAEMPDAGFSKAAWSGVSKGTFRTASNVDTRSRTIVIGSCRYLLKTFFGSFFDDRGDKTFLSMLKQIEKGTQIDQIIMMGDQIYADDLNFLRPDTKLDEFCKRYREAFSQKHIQNLMSQVPTYMTLDDHEIEDNWPEKASEKEWKTLFPAAIHAYQAYQLCHSPCIPVKIVKKTPKLDGTPSRLWYKYSDGCCDVFVTDSRTERFLSNGNRQMISTEQMRALKRWIADGSGRVKLVVTSVPFAPDSSSSEGKDKWAGFQDQRRELLEHIETKQIQKVVFCSGDVHASMSVELVSPTNLKIVSIVSSAFFWPYPHPSARHFSLRGHIDGGKAGNFALQNASKVISDDNFTRLKISPKKVVVDVFARKGKRLRPTVEHQF